MTLSVALCRARTLVFAACLLAGAERAARAEDAPPAPTDPAVIAAQAMEQAGKAQQAVEALERAAREALPADPIKAADRLSAAARIRSRGGDDAHALALDEEARALYARAGRDAGLMDAEYSVGADLAGLKRYPEALVHLQAALALARRLGKTEEAATVAFNIGVTRILGGGVEAGVAEVRRSLGYFREPGREANLAAGLKVTADILYSVRQYAAALPFSEEALAIHHRMGKADDEALDHASLGLMNDELGRTDEALGHYQQAIAAERRLGLEDRVAIHLNNLGTLYDQIGKVDAAAAALEEAVAIRRRRHPEALGGLVSNLASVYLHAARFDDARRAAEEVVAMARALGPDGADTLRAALVTLGHVAEKSLRYEAGRIALEEALAIARARGEEAEVAQVLGRLARLYWSWDRYEEAQRYAEQTIAAARRLALDDLLNTTLTVLGRVLKARGRAADSAAAFGEALVLSRRGGVAKDIAASLDDVAHASIDEGRYADAIAQSNEALALARGAGAAALTATILNTLHLAYRAQGDDKKAMTCLEQALAIDEKGGDQGGQAARLQNMAVILDGWGRDDEALDRYQRALAIVEARHDEAQIGIIRGNVGDMLSNMGRFAEARVHFDAALEIARRLDRPDDIRTAYQHLGIHCRHLGRYDDALGYLQQALAIDRRLNEPPAISTRLTQIATVYADWNQQDKALAIYDEAMAVEVKLGRARSIALLHNNIAAAKWALGLGDEAMAHFHEAMVIDERLGQQRDLAGDLSNMGSVLLGLGRTAEAAAHFERALAIGDKSTDEGLRATLESNLGNVYLSRGEHAKAVAAYEAALAIDRRLGRRWHVAVRLGRLGQAWLHHDEPRKAEGVLREAITLLESVRLTATGAARRDFLAAQIGAYHLLVSTLFRMDRPTEAFETSELARAKVLAEAIAHADVATPITAAAARRSLGEHEAALVLAYADEAVMAGVLITRGGLVAHQTDLGAIAASGLARPHDVGGAGLRGARQLEDKAPAAAQAANLEALVAAFRAALTRPGPAGRSEAQRLGRQLYTLFVKPAAAGLAGKTELVVVPEGVLGMVPFEALVDDEGRYLGERFTITYAHSLTVREQLRARRLPANRAPLIAFGGAVYRPAPAPTAPPSEHQIEAVREAATRGGSLAASYATLGLGNWSDLPGTLAEVRDIAKWVPGARVITGAEVAEPALKAMARSGELARYRVLHFATHGLVVPQAPELSALVLSQGQAASGEDGYMRADEIAQLKLAADFVNLSACETGLGKVYGGEGVVGLAQAFLAAGTNGLSLSLWSVADASTATFMSEVYRTAAVDHVSYVEAIGRTKRRFIRGDFGPEYRDPFYWAPFVYYGI